MAPDSSAGLCPYPEDCFIHWKDDVTSVRKLYRERKYRRCAILCSECLKEAIHPVHQTFLYFYQAICYESLGHIAHNYSSNKVPLLEQARDAFLLASETLPNAGLEATKEEPRTLQHSPAHATFDIALLYGTPTPSSNYTTRSLQLTDDQQHAEDYTTAPMSQCRISRTYPIPNFEDCSPRKPLPATRSPQHIPSQVLLTPNQHAFQGHKNRLSRSLSSQHALAEELVPSPLFSRGPFSKKESESNSIEPCSPVIPHILTQVTLCKPLPPLPPSRPLPHLPFNHNPYFIRKGKRFVVVPRRKTALSTLISKFEGKGPFATTASSSKEAYNDAVGEPVKQSFGRTPVTERFNKISAVFAEKKDERMSFQSRSMSQRSLSQPVDRTSEYSEIDEDKSSSDKENISPTTTSNPIKPPPFKFDLREQNPYPFNPATPCPRPKVRPESRPNSPKLTQSPPDPINYLQSAPSPSTAYAHLLTTFLSCLNTHITTISHTITQTHEIQQQHDLEKRARFAKAYASRSFSSPSSSPAQKIRPLHSFWSLQIVEKDACEDDKARSGSRDNDGSKDEAKKERIRQLKERGWDVKKEKVGFKGVEYYEEFASRAERELEMSTC